MKKKSLAISDSQRFGHNSPAVAVGEANDVERKTAPTIELAGPQVDAFCTCSLKPGEKGTATIHYVVKSVRMGDEYGSDVPGKKSTKRVTLSISHVEAEGEAEGEDNEEEEDAEKTPAAEEPESATSKKPVSPNETGLDDV